MTPEQINLARHALGLDGVRKVSCRNHYVTGAGAPDHKEWLDMVSGGNAQKRDGKTLPYGGDDLFWLTRAGATASLRGEERLSPEDFPEEVEA